MATRTISNAGGNYNNTAAWVEGIVPTSADDVVATATSGNLTVNVASVAKTFILTNYVGLLTINNTLTVSGTVTLVNTATYSGTGTLACATTATLTSNGVVWPGSLTLQGASQSFTLGDNWSITGLFTAGGTSPTLLGSGKSLTVNGGITITSSMGGTGNAKVILKGGTWSGSGTTWFDLDLQGNITVSGSVTFGSQASSIRTIKYISGTITTTGSTLIFAGNNVIFDTNGITWNNLTLTNLIATNNFQLNSLLTIGGNFTHAAQAGNYTLTFTGTAGMTCANFIFYGASTVGSSTTINFKTGVTYTITNSIILDGIVGTLNLKSASVGTKATLTLNSNITQKIVNCTVQDIDSSGGDTASNYFGGTNSNTTNWNTGPTYSYGYIS